MTRVLVTGGAGFIGSHACKALAAEVNKLVVIDNLSTGHADAVRWGELVNADIRNVDAVTATLKSQGIDTVMHFAASTYVGESVLHPGRYYDNNVGGMISLLDACGRAQVERFIFSSSCATYGIPAILSITEETPQRPISPYGRTKLMGELMLRDHSAATGMRHVILRYFNACGCDPGGELSERHDPETHLIPLALKAAAGHIPALEIFGTDYDTPDGTCIRDYIHVSDLAVGHAKALRYLQMGGPNISVNLGCGTGTSVFDIIRAVHRVTGVQVPVNLADRRPGDPPVLLADVTRAKVDLAFKASLSDIDTIIRHAAPSFGLEVHSALNSLSG